MNDNSRRCPWTFHKVFFKEVKDKEEAKDKEAAVPLIQVSLQFLFIIRKCS